MELLHAISLNARSLVNKVVELEEILIGVAPDVMFVTETWFNESILSSEFEALGYIVVARKDRQDTFGGRGGGVLILAKETLGCIEVPIIDVPQVCSVIIQGVTLVAVYLSPNASDEDRSALNGYLADICDHSIIVGDFNHPHIDWTLMSGRSANDENLLRSIEDAYLTQMVDFPTHV